MPRSPVRCAVFTILATGFFPTAYSQADLVQSYASGTGVSSNLEVINGVLELSVGPLGTASGTGSPGFNQSGHVANVNAEGTFSVLGLVDVPVLSLTTDALDATAMSDVDGLPGSRTTSASAEVDNLSFDIAAISPIAVVSSLVSLNATVIQSTAMVTGGPGALVASGSTTLAGTAGINRNQASLVVAGVEFLLDAAPGPNTSLVINGSVIPGLNGTIELFLNEQIEMGDGIDSRGLTTNALRLSFTDFGVGLGPSLGLLNGDLIIASSTAMHSTPEPAAAGMIAIFLALAWGCRRYRRLITMGSQSVPTAA